MAFGKKKSETDGNQITWQKYPHLNQIRPREGYKFHSDYYMVDGKYVTIRDYFHTEGATDNFGPFWGINRIPQGLDQRVKIFVFEQVERMSEGWISSHESQAEGISNMGENEARDAGTNKTRGIAAKRTEDLAIVSRELQDGSAYLHVHWRLMIQAPSLEILDDSVGKIDRMYMDRFATLNVAPYQGRQREELSNLFARNSRKIGHGFYFTSKEFAGDYSLVTHGLEDKTGEFVGNMVGDVNNSAVLFDVDGYRHHIVVANDNYNEAMGRVHIPDMWGSKISQAAMLNNHKVVHIILDNCNLDNPNKEGVLGPEFKSICYHIDMNHGDVNMFEMFGDVNDELAVFAMQMQKLILMAEQAYETNDSDRAIIRGSLEQIATKFYIDNRMWFENAKSHRDKLRVIGIPHEQVPKLEMFVSYLDMEYKAIVNQTARDEEKVHALNVLSTTFKNLLSNNGDLFNTTTTSVIDGAKTGIRTVYDFSQLMFRGEGVAMAQLVNIIAFAVGNLGYGDVVIIHGAEFIDDGIKPYVKRQLDKLFDKGGRVAYLYNKTDEMIKQKEFNEFDKANYTIFGNMTETTVKNYQKALAQDIPVDLQRLITNKSDSICYIRRGYDNVVFRQQLYLGLPDHRRRSASAKPVIRRKK